MMMSRVAVFMRWCLVRQKYHNDDIIFCNGGDRTNQNIPEMALEGIKFEFGVGGN